MGFLKNVTNQFQQGVQQLAASNAKPSMVPQASTTTHNAMSFNPGGNTGTSQTTHGTVVEPTAQSQPTRAAPTQNTSTQSVSQSPQAQSAPQYRPPQQTAMPTISAYQPAQQYQAPAQPKIQPTSSFDPKNVQVSVSAPSQRTYEGFSADKALDERASNFKLSDDSMVENRLSGLLGQNSDYLKRAQAKAAVVSNRRGMLNSSIAAGAGTAAAIDAALPIAQQDASTHAQSDLTKQGYFNNQSLADQQAVNTSKLSAQDATQQSGAMQQQTESTGALNSQQGQINENIGSAADNRQLGLQNNQGSISERLQQEAATQQSALSAQQAQQQSNQSQRDFEYQQTLQLMDQDSRANLLQMQNANAALLQQSQSAANRFQDLAQQISAISTSPDINPEQKAAAINQLMTLSNKSLATQAELLKAAGVSGVEMTQIGEAESSGPAPLPTEPSDPQINFTPSAYDRGNQEALRAEISRLGELANKLPANTPEGVKARQSHIQAQLKDLDIQYYSTTSANAQRQIRGEMGRKQAELDQLNKQAAQYAQPATTPAPVQQAQIPAAQPDWSQLLKTINFAGLR